MGIDGLEHPDSGQYEDQTSGKNLLVTARQTSEKLFILQGIRTIPENLSKISLPRARRKSS
jgi:hypothetical protein